MSTSISGQYMSNCYYFSVSETNLLTVYFRVSLSLSLSLYLFISLSPHLSTVIEKKKGLSNKEEILYIIS